MAIQIYDTAVLNKVVSLMSPPSTFLLDVYFPMVQEGQETTDMIAFDVVKDGAPGIAPFVSPLVEGQVVTERGFETNYFKPAYVKDVRRLEPDSPVRRMPGEQIGGSLSAMARRQRQVNDCMRNQLQRLTMREVTMSADFLVNGTITVTGEKYPTQVVDFGRNANLEVALLTTDRWGESGVVPLDDIEDWAGLVQTYGSVASNVVTMDPKAWKLFRNSLGERELHYDRGYAADFILDPSIYGPEAASKAQYKGSSGSFQFFVYQDVYTNMAGARVNVLPDYSVIIGGAGGQGTRAYGMIYDEEAGYRSTRYFAKSWIKKDPAIRIMLMQSAPLPVPYNPNAFFYAKVHDAS